MVIVGRMGTETCFKYCVFSSNVFFFCLSSGSGNVSGIYVVFTIKVFYMVMVGDHHWGVVIVEGLTKISKTSINQMTKFEMLLKIIMRAVYIILNQLTMDY